MACAYACRAVNALRLCRPDFSEIIDMLKNQLRCAPEVPGAVGIVVKSGQPATSPSRGAAFVWGAGVSSAPSLPFGRWKEAVRSAA
jgi:hypothetical protein